MRSLVTGLVLLGLAAAGGCGDEGNTLAGGDGVTNSTPGYSVTFAVTESIGVLGALQFDADHRGSSGGWIGGGGTVACDWNVEGGITACNDTGAGRIRCAIASISGFETPTDVVTCVFRTSEPVDETSFDLTVIDASTPDFEKTFAPMAVSSVESIPLEELPPVEPPVRPDLTPSHLIVAAIDSDAGRVGALQFDIVFEGIEGYWDTGYPDVGHNGSVCWFAGGFVSADGALRVADRAAGTVRSCNAIAGDRMRCAIASIPGIETPGEIVACEFRSDLPVSDNDFIVELVDASDTELNRVTFDMTAYVAPECEFDTPSALEAYEFCTFDSGNGAQDD